MPRPTQSEQRAIRAAYKRTQERKAKKRKRGIGTPPLGARKQGNPLNAKVSELLGAKKLTAKQLRGIKVSALRSKERKAIKANRKGRVVARKRRRKRRSYPIHPQSIRVVVMTYERPGDLLKLLRDLYVCSQGYRISVTVYDDASKADYADVRTMLTALGWSYTRAEKNHGKRGHFKWISRSYADQRLRKDDLFIFIPDDVRLCKDFFARAISAWNAVTDGNKGTLTILRDSGGNRGWTRPDSQDLGGYRNTGWVDGAFICTRVYLSALWFRVPHVPASRWAKNPTLGSGVGPATSRAALAAGLELFAVTRSLLVHTGVKFSTMNQAARKENPLLAVGFVDGEVEHDRLLFGRTEPMVVSVASMPHRRRMLERVVASLYWQCDRLNVYLNGYPDIPSFLHRPKIKVATSQEYGDRGDAGKFFWATELSSTPCYHFTCDDDILYPKDYLERIRRHIDIYKRKAVVTLHGAVLPKRLTESFYRERHVFHCARDVEKDKWVHVPGTGVMGYHTSVPVRTSWFRIRNMADVWMAVNAKKAVIPIVVMAHRGYWLSFLPDPQPELAIYRKHANHDTVQTRVVRAAGVWRRPISALRA